MLSHIAKLSRHTSFLFYGELTKLYSTQVRWKPTFSVYDAFKNGLPDLVNKDKRPNASTGQGGNYTIATVPPKVWVQWEYDDNISKAHQYVEGVKEKLDNISVIEGAGLTSIDDKSSEQDVIKLFNLHVMYPIELPEDYKLKTRCEAHPEKGRAVRVDIILEAYSASNPQYNKTLAIMEMKSLGGITDEMGNIMAAKVASVQEAEKVKPTSGVRFEDDSMLLLKRCATYATKFKTRHVALCDWSVAIYLDFVGLHKALQETREEGGFAGQFVLLYA